MVTYSTGSLDVAIMDKPGKVSSVTKLTGSIQSTFNEVLSPSSVRAIATAMWAMHKDEAVSGMGKEILLNHLQIRSDIEL